VRVLNAAHLPIIYATDSKTDKIDALKLTDRPDSRLPACAAGTGGMGGNLVTGRGSVAGAI
jgi:hypothetical protein